MQKKYQVFVSSTYEDLRTERQEVIQALLELDCIPAGMELFPAANDDQWSLIKSVIDECDYYILIIAGRYGSVGPDDLSYTEMEYRYALETGKPIIAFLHKDPSSIAAKFVEKSEKKQKKLDEFRKLAQEKMCKFWDTASELGSIVSRSIIRLQRDHPGVGWVRGDNISSEAASQEILELRKHIDELENKLDQASTNAPPGTEKFAQGEDEFLIYANAEATKYGPNGGNWKIKNLEIPIEWNHIFYYISPLMMNECDEFTLLRAFRECVKESGEPIFRKILDNDEETKGAGSLIIEATKEDFHTCIVQFNALGYIRKSEKNRSVKDTKSYWTLTPFGETVMMQLRAIEKDSD